MRVKGVAIDLQVNSCRTKEVFLEETLLKKGFFQTIFPKLLISYCTLISGNLELKALRIKGVASYGLKTLLERNPRLVTPNPQSSTRNPESATRKKE
jgi:hypothetical protein